MAELTKQANEVQSLLNEGQFGAVWFPATTAKDAALALLDNHASDLTDQQRITLSGAVKRIVVSAWDIDAFGDLGDKQKLNEAFKVFSAAVADIKGVYASVH